MDTLNAKFIKSCPSIESCPPADKPEYAFIGRSNVGKSSLINMLTGHNKLAKTSGKPGKTQLINHFLINDKWYLVDLPGYGYAKISKEQREKFDSMIRTYILNRENLYAVFVLVDSNIPPQEKDLDFIRWLGENQVPFSIVFTKTDRLTKNEIQSSLAKYKKALLKDWETIPEHFISSSVNRSGRLELIAYIDGINQNAKER